MLRPLLISSLLLAHSAVSAAGDVEIQKIAVENACVACHAEGYRRIGPSYVEIAEAYSSIDPGIMADALLVKTRTGSVGVWGDNYMYGQPQGTDEEIRALIYWMLTRFKPEESEQ